MNENEIITALECCISEEVQGCKDCLLLELSRDCDECRTELMKQTLDLIKRKNAESEELKRRNQNLTSENENLTSALKSAKAEIEELQSELIITKNNFDNVKDRYDEAVRISQRRHEKLVDAYKKLQTAKSEARKELAERVKDDIRNICPDRVFEYDEVESVIDNLLAEMESEQECINLPLIIIIKGTIQEQ